jgi:CHAD domain-containing protein
MRELELKLAVHGSFVMPPLYVDGLVTEVEELPTLDMRTTYYDTPSLQLARWGITLRHRTGEEGGARWTLKLPVPSEGPGAHEERHFSGASNRVPDDAKDLVTAFVRHSSLSSVAAIRTRRHRWMLIDDAGEDLAEVVDDEVSVLQSRRVVGRFRELEIEDRRLGRGGLEEIAAVLKSAGAMAAEPIPKFVRALGARATADPDVPADVPLSPDDPAGRAVQAALARGLSRLLANDPGVRIGEDPEPVHQMRVGARRLRSDLRTFAPLIDESWAADLVEDLRWIGGGLGDVRDLDVQIGHFSAVSGDLSREVRPLFDHLREQRERARAVALEELRSARYRDALDRLIEAVNAPVFTPSAQEPCVRALPPLVAGAWRKLERNGRSLKSDDTDEDFHKVRIRAKRARYAAEAVAPALGSAEKDALRFAKRCSALQDVLGAIQDAVVATNTLLEVASRHRSAGALNIALGRLVERESARRKSMRESFADVWKDLDSKKVVSWLKT